MSSHHWDGTPNRFHSHAALRAWLEALVVIASLTGHAWLVLHGAWKNYATIDEVGHIAAGLDHWATGRYRMYNVNPPLARMVAVLPVLGMAADTSRVRAVYGPGVRSEFLSGYSFASDNGDRYLSMLRAARLAGVAWSVIGAVIVLCWARRLYGGPAGCLALAMWCFEPNVIAHAQLVTPDLPATVAGLAATYAFWQYLRSPSWGRVGVAGALLGVAQLTKFTMVFLYPVWVGLWLSWRIARNSHAPQRSRLPVQLAQGTIIACLSIVVINFGYGWEGTLRRVGDIPFISDTFAGEGVAGEGMGPAVSGNRWQGTWLGSIPLPVPVDYVLGIDVQRRDFERLGKVTLSYLAGEWRERGWWYYYVYALAVKVPLGLWALVLWGIVLSLGRHPSTASFRDELTLWLPALAVLLLVSSQTGFNHHLRYVLPLFPFVIIATGKVGYYLCRERWKGGIVVSGLVVWAIFSSVRTHPHELSYFNELAGGPDNGHRHLLNSNIDWGQDLLFLKQWLNEHPEAQPLRLAYRNVVDPRIEGIEFALPPYGLDAIQPPVAHGMIEVGPQPGYYAISVSYLYGAADIPVPDGKGGRVSLPRNAYLYFQRFEPIAKAGYSIFIYHISLDEANRVRHDLGLPELIEAEVRPAGATAREAKP